MKRTFILMGFVALNWAHSQTGKVGINTENPTEVLHINGTVRVSELPVVGAVNSIYTKKEGIASTNKDQTFNGNRVVLVDENGVLGKGEGRARALSIVGSNAVVVNGATLVANNNTEMILSNYGPADNPNYDPKTGIYTVTKSGLYNIYGGKRLVVNSNNAKKENFNGSYGIFELFLRAKPIGSNGAMLLARDYLPIYKGVYTDATGGHRFAVNSTVWLNEGEKVYLSCNTYGVGYVSENPNNLSIRYIDFLIRKVL